MSQMFNIYFLSIRKKYVEMILTGSKQWEFRQNPTFGSSLEPGDLLFLVSTSEAGSEISCLCKVKNILRGEKVQEGFDDYETGRWREAGCEDNTERDWDFFVDNILHQYPTAIKLGSHPVSPSIALSQVAHKTSRKTWKGIGLTPLSHLQRYTVGDESADQYFGNLASQVMIENK